jgi:hypothetical protein
VLAGAPPIVPKGDTERLLEALLLPPATAVAVVTVGVTGTDLLRDLERMESR